MGVSVRRRRSVFVFRRVDSLLAPESIAITGAAPTPGNWGMRVAQELDRYGYAGPVTLISPKYDAIEGYSTVRSLQDIAEVPDHVVALVSASRTVDLLETAAQLGSRSATVLAAGFDELGTEEGRELGDRLRDIGTRYDLAICGPNCLGFLSRVSGASTFAERYPRATNRGGFGLISQSGGMMGGVVRHLSERGLGLSHAISTGNELNRDVADFLHFMANDSETTAVGVLLEGVRRPVEFAAACEELLAAGKPVILFQSGRTPRGQAAVMSHTGVLAASGATMDAVASYLNVIRVESVAEFVEVAEAAMKLPVPTTLGLGIIALSGGARNMIVDAEDEFDLPIAELSAGTLAALDKTLPVGTNVGNPVDIGMVGISPNLRSIYVDTLNIVLSDPGVGVVAIQDELPGESAPASHLDGLVEIAELGRAYGKSIAFFGKANYQLEAAERAARDRVAAPFLQDVHNSMKALGQLLRYYSARSHRLALPKLSQSIGSEADAADGREAGQATATVHALEALERNGVPVAAYAVIDGTETSASAYKGSWPVAVKVIADGLEHKTDIGGVVLNVASPEQLDDEIAAMRLRIGQQHPVLVQEMIGSGVLEIFVSCYDDSQFGWMLLIGVGGLWAEPIASVSSYVLPRSFDEVRRAIDESVIGRILHSGRGQLVLDSDEIYRAVESICRTAVDPAMSLRRLEVNPLLVGRAGPIVVDIVMETGSAQRVGQER